jgi:hypothetical protein
MTFQGPGTTEISTLNVDQKEIQALQAWAIDPDTTRLRLRPAADWHLWPHDTIRAWCVTAAIYCIPTLELVEWLKEKCTGKTCLEVGSGNNDLYFHLGIKGSDNYMQVNPAIALHLFSLGQMPTTPHHDVELADAENLVRKMKPDVVIGAWVTERFDKNDGGKGGNMFGPRSEYLIERCGSYILIGHERVHANIKALRLPHETLRFPWLVSRARDQERNAIFVWHK